MARLTQEEKDAAMTTLAARLGNKKLANELIELVYWFRFEAHHATVASVEQAGTSQGVYSKACADTNNGCANHLEHVLWGEQAQRIPLRK